MIVSFSSMEKDRNKNSPVNIYYSNIPKYGEDYKKGWEDYYFKLMKDYFSKK